MASVYVMIFGGGSSGEVVLGFGATATCGVSCEGGGVVVLGSFFGTGGVGDESDDIMVAAGAGSGSGRGTKG